jgi:hypothetical protein
MPLQETFRLEYVKCGKQGCKKCPHGPYWYGYHTWLGRTSKRYIGKVLPKQLQEKIRRELGYTPNQAARLLLTASEAERFES